MIKNWKHNELQEDLARHIRKNGDRVVWTDIPMGSVGNCRPDVYSMPKSFTKFRPLIYEIKVSVSDFRSDITSGKWQKYLDYACAVIFAVPAGMISKEDVPKGCGLIVRHDEVWRSAKSPTLQVVETLPHELWMKLMINGLDRQRDEEFREKVFNSHNANRKLSKKFGEKIGALLSSLDHAEYRIQFATQEANKLADQINADRQRKLQEALVENSRAAAVKAELAVALGLSEDASIFEISNQCKKIAKRLDENQEIERLQSLIENIQKAVNRSIEQSKEEIPRINDAKSA